MHTSSTKEGRADVLQKSSGATSYRSEARVAVRAQAAFALGSIAKALVDNHSSEYVGTDDALRILEAPETRVRASALRAAGYLVALRASTRRELSDALVDCCADALTSEESSTKQAPPKVRRNACIALSVAVAASGEAWPNGGASASSYW